jgi:hypothetical protein
MSATQTALALLVGLFSIFNAAQAVPSDLGIPEIKNMVDDIDFHLKRLNRSRVMLQTGTDRGGELAVYRRGSDVVRIDATIGGSNSDLQEVFYYVGAKVVFVRTKTVTYPYSPSANGFDFANPHVKATADYYVRDNKLIPVGHAKIASSVAARLLQEAELFMIAIRRGDHVVDVERVLK